MKEKSIFKIFLKIVLTFILITIVSFFISTLLTGVVKYYKYGTEFIGELFVVIIVMIVMLLSKKTFVFTEKKDKFFKSLLLGLPLLLLSTVILIFNALSLDSFSFGNFINLILYTFTIGIAEEFLWRGWLQNEFIERFKTNKKQIILSIILSSLLFGGFHIINIFAGQTLFETLLQVLQATIAGVYLGLIYYKTKNIWSVIFLHGFYDFSLMLAEVNNIKDCTTTTPTKEIALFNIFCSIVIILFYILSIIVTIRKFKNNELKENGISETELKKDKKINGLLWCGIVAMIIFVVSPIDKNINGHEDYHVCYEYKERVVESFETHYPHFKVVNINYENYNFEIYFNEEDILELKDLNSKEIINLEDNNIIDFEIIENNNNYMIMIYSYNSRGDIIYYKKINKTDLSNLKQHLTNIKETFITYELPVISSLGYITIEGDEYKYPLILTELNEKLVISEKNELEIWNCNC